VQRAGRRPTTPRANALGFVTPNAIDVFTHDGIEATATRAAFRLRLGL